jgi:hypothetical protein
MTKKIKKNKGITNNSLINIFDDGNKVVIESLKDDEPIVEEDGILVFTGKILSNPDKELITNRGSRLKKVLNNR